MNNIIDKIRDQIHILSIEDCFGCVHLKESLRQHTCANLNWCEKIDIYYPLAVERVNTIENLELDCEDISLKLAVENDPSDC